MTGSDRYENENPRTRQPLDGIDRYRVWYRNHVPLDVRRVWCRLFSHHEWDDGVEWGCKRCDHYQVRHRGGRVD